MNILCVPQMSMYDKQTKKYLPMADGNINMLRNTINEWLKYRPEDKFYVLIPEEVFNPHIDLKIPCQYLTYKNSVVSARINRFNFTMAEYIGIFKRMGIKFDLLLCDIIELTSNFKQMFNIEFGYTPKVISNIRHVDSKLNHNYIWRVLDGIIQSDLITILSDSMKKELKKQFNIAGLDWRFRDELFNKVIVFEPSISEKELMDYRMNAMIKDMTKVIITFPGRLAKGEERRTNWDKFIEAVKILRTKRQDFEVYFTDPNNALNSDMIEQEEWTKTIPKDRSAFLNLLNKTDVIVSLMDVEGFGGISIREALLFGCLPVIPEVHEYKKMVASGNYSGFVDSPITVEDLTDALDWAVGFAKRRSKTRYFTKEEFMQIGKQFAVEEQFKKLLPKIEELL